MNALPPQMPLTDLRLSLFRNGYRPVPVSDPNPMLSNGGKAPFLQNWKAVAAAATEATIEGWATRPRNHGNTGLLTGDLIGLDLDIPVPALADQIGRMADAMLGASPLVRIGKAPKSLRCYRAEVPMQKMETAELVLPCGTVAQVEVMGDGQQVVAFGIHPATMQPYRWQGVGPDTVPLTQLPVLGEAPLRAFLAAAEAVLRAAGGRTKKEVEAAEKAEAEPARSPPRPDTGASKTRAKGDSKFFLEVNKRALANIGPWFKALFSKGEEQTGGGLTKGCWRVSSADLGRGLEEDISVHPTDGGHDFGTGESCSPIDLAIEWGGAANAKEAAFFLCDTLGIAPADCGWQEPKPKKERPAREERKPTGLPLIAVTAGELHNNTTAAEDAIIGAAVPIFQRGSDLVRPVSRETPASDGRTTLAAGLHDLSAPGLVDVFSAIAEWERYDARAEAMVRINPPRQVADILLSRYGSWRFPPIAGVVTTPTMRPDGSILSAPGYDPATRLYHVADPALRLHPDVERPTRDLALRALKVLEALLIEFPLVGTVSKAVVLSALITPIVRGAISVAPMHLFRAPTPGSGKSYLADVSSAITSGRPCPVITAAPSEEETEKRLVGLLLAGFPLISLDNVNGELGGDLLCQAIERPLVRVRPLGRSDIVEIESKCTILGTGNNARVRGDMVRRTLVADLDPDMERPEERQFNGDPVATVLADRGKYVSACLVIARAYLLAGSPGKLPAIASFGAWSDLVRSAIVWLGGGDAAESMKTAREDDPELGEMREMMGAWNDAFGSLPQTIKQAVDVAMTPTQQADEDGDTHSRDGRLVLPYPQLQEAFTRIAGTRVGVVDAKKLGYWLQAHQGRVVSIDGIKERLRFQRDGTTGGVARWRLSRSLS